MSGGERIPLELADIAAHQVLDALAPGCERIAIAGSIRRRRLDVGDIEIVAIPRVHTERVREGLFEDRDLEVDELQVCIDLAMMDGTLTAHPDDPKRGPRYSKLTHAASGIQVDVFSCRRDTWGLALLIRTGPAAYSHWLVNEARARYFHVANGYELHPGRIACGAIPCEPIPTPDEDTVFRVLQLHPAGPEARG
jgi:DNA polymerase/3'-5' exonuclease PolX